MLIYKIRRFLRPCVALAHRVPFTERFTAADPSQGCWPFKDDAAGLADVGRADRRCARPPAAAAPHHGLRTARTAEDQPTTPRPCHSRSGDGRQAEAAAPVEASRSAPPRPGLLHASVQSQVQLSDKEGCEPGRRRRRRNHEPGLFPEPVGAAGAEPLGPRRHPERLHRDVVLGLPVVSVLLAVRPRRRRSAHVGHAAAPPVGPPHHAGSGQRRLPGLALWSRHHKRGGGLCVPCGGEGHGAAGGSGVRRGPDLALHHHLLLPHPGHAVRTRGGARRRPEEEERSHWLQHRAPPADSGVLLQPSLDQMETHQGAVVLRFWCQNPAAADSKPPDQRGRGGGRSFSTFMLSEEEEQKPAKTGSD